MIASRIVQVTRYSTVLLLRTGMTIDLFAIKRHANPFATLRPVAQGRYAPPAMTRFICVNRTLYTGLFLVGNAEI